ncbi:pentapeptide repeat-containing protein [Nonomuraea sp. NPDC050478]|uniref:pentapeptide repeat-containing protein n=1 Tax=Nonomuraea sp. NPDC050478 TaxID=3364365 RepID=UPI0037B49032
MKPSSIIVVALVLVTVPALVWMLGPGATWVLENIDGVTLDDGIPPPASSPPNELTGTDWAAAVAAVRGNVLAVATGLAALLAVFYTARNADTARRTFRLGERGHDTDRFSKAVEQLGGGPAPVRLGGLYALEQLAQNNPRLRQTVVDVICAYLRMPWTPPREEDRQQRIRAAQRAARTRSPDRTETRAGRAPEEERQVRLTAQRLLADHLAWCERRWWQRPASVNPRFWPGMRLDLSYATLLDFGLANCRVLHADFHGATFIGRTSFSRATFVGDASFTGYASFHSATFTGHADFGGAAFTDYTAFRGATFASHADFYGATFGGSTWFEKASFSEEASFLLATFKGTTSFDQATFSGTVSFDKATFAGRVTCTDVRVTHPNPGSTWPPGWRLEYGRGGAVLRRDG